MTISISSAAVAPLRRIAMAGALLFVVPFTAACGGIAHVEHPEVTDSLQDDVHSARTVLSRLEQHPMSAKVAAELRRTDGWLKVVETRIENGDEPSPEIRLTLKAARTQLSFIRSYYYRYEAEVALKDVKERYGVTGRSSKTPASDPSPAPEADEDARPPEVSVEPTELPPAPSDDASPSGDSR